MVLAAGFVGVLFAVLFGLPTDGADREMGTQPAASNAAREFRLAALDPETDFELAPFPWEGFELAPLDNDFELAPLAL